MLSGGADWVMAFSIFQHGSRRHQNITSNCTRNTLYSTWPSKVQHAASWKYPPPAAQGNLHRRVVLSTACREAASAFKNRNSEKLQRRQASNKKCMVSRLTVSFKPHPANPHHKHRIEKPCAVSDARGAAVHG